MQVLLIDEDQAYTLSLPSIITGKHWIEDRNSGGLPRKILAIEANAESNQWVVVSQKNILLFEKKDEFLERIYLMPGRSYNVLFNDSQKTAVLLIEEDDESYIQFRKYLAEKDAILTVGRTEGQNIQLNNPMVTADHMVISYQNNTWIILEAKGRNGVYVNSKRIKNLCALSPGDVVTILFYKFIIGYDFIAFNNPKGTVTVNSKELNPLNTNKAHYNVVNQVEEKYYYRSPRFMENIPECKIDVDMPTLQEKVDNTPILLTIAPAMLMGLASVSTGIISIINTLENDGSILKALPTMIMALSMLGGMIVFPSIMKKRERKKQESKEKDRRTKYINYLNTIRKEIDKAKKNQEKIWRDKYPNIIAYTRNRDFWNEKLWERTSEHEDFLDVRLGTGSKRMNLEITFPEERFTIEEDVLRDELSMLQKEEHLLSDVPITVSLFKNRVFGIVGDKQGVLNLLNNFLLQIMLLHGYDEVKIVLIHESNDLNELSYVRKAQHLWDDKQKRRYLAVTDNNLRELNVEMSHILNNRADEKSENDVKIPHYIIVSTSKKMSTKCSFLSDILKNPIAYGVSVICAYDEVKNLPKECHSYVMVNEKTGIFYSDNIQNPFVQDLLVPDEVSKSISEMSRYTLDLQQGKYDLPEMLTFMDMFSVGNIKHLNILQRWKQNNPVESLRAPIGVDTNGEIFYLDLHEKFHGPHGLVAGMTGSGKSEFLITYILSMAVNYHPDEVAFVLIDYKGGGLTGAFDNDHYRLPHLAGTITNLDGNAVMRAILSIKSELRKRQQIFNEARVMANEGTMDIYKYQKLYRDQKVGVPVPHLFIIADEFAELKSQQPEFLEQLISTARIGRSLGVHLILATQKPSGVVSEQIWANSKFKVCLKVQDRADSMDMLKRPDAASLVETGRFYLQVGYNELFELGQSSWCGAPYVETDDQTELFDESIDMIDELGNVLDKLKDSMNTGVQSQSKQIVSIMEYLDELAEISHVSERQLWQSELPKLILEDELLHKYQDVSNDGLSVIVGEVDDPYSQSKHALFMDFTGKGNVLLYGATGSGKELLLSTMLYAMYQKYTAHELNVFIMDFGSEFLRNFEEAPQTAMVAVDEQTEKVEALFNYLYQEVKNRKKQLSEFGGSFQDYKKEVPDCPYMLVILNNYLQFVENNERFEEDVIALSREGQRYGLYFVITATSSNAVRYRLTQNYTQSLVLQMNDKNDYISILGNTGGIYPAPVKGRGIIKDGETYVFQIADVVEEEVGRKQFIKDYCARLATNAIDKKKVIVNDQTQSVWARDLQGEANGLCCVPVGINEETQNVETLNILEDVKLILAENASDVRLFAQGIAEGLSTQKDLRIIYLDLDAVLRTNERVENANEKMANTVTEIFEIALKRNNDFKTFGIKATQPILIIFVEFAKIMDSLDEELKFNLRRMLKREMASWNMSFLIFDSYSASKKYSIDQWVQNHVGKNGIWVGRGVEDQNRFAIGDKKNLVLEEINDHTGFIIENQQVRRINICLPTSEEEEA